MAYADTTELARVLNIRVPSDNQEAAFDRVIEAATMRIDSEIDLAADASLDGGQIALAEQVCLAYAAELWKFQEVQFGLVGIGSEVGATFVPRDLWEKYAIQLEPLKNQWGLA